MSKFMKLFFILTLSLGLWQICGSTVMAQNNYSRINRPFNRPTVSPYLNLYRGGNGPVSNYFGVVRPQQQFYAQNERFGEQLQDVRERQSQAYNPRQMRRRIPGVYTMGVTGHASGFNTIRPNGSGEGGPGTQLSGFNAPQGGSQFGGDSEQSSFGGGYGSGSGLGSSRGSGAGSGFGRGGF